jgi:tetratricopeptide (TPR) repeat protein
MGFRLYKSVKLGKGVRLNLSKTGVGISAGVPGARYSVHSSGRTVKTVGVPGTGVYYRKDRYSKGSRAATPRGTPAPVAPAYPRAGTLAPKAEKLFVQGVTAYMQGRYEQGLAALKDVSLRDTVGAHVGEEFFAGMCLVGLERIDEAVPYLETVLASDYPIPDPLMTKYHVGGDMEVGVTVAVSVTVPMSNLATALILAEVYQRTDQRQKAIGLLETLGAEAPGELVFALSLADLYFEGEQWDDVLRVTEGVTTNEDDVTLNILGFRACALNEKGLSEAALSLTKEAFGRRSGILPCCDLPATSAVARTRTQGRRRWPVRSSRRSTPRTLASPTLPSGSGSRSPLRHHVLTSRGNGRSGSSRGLVCAEHVNRSHVSRRLGIYLKTLPAGTLSYRGGVPLIGSPMPSKRCAKSLGTASRSGEVNTRSTQPLGPPKYVENPSISVATIHARSSGHK